MNTSLSGRLLIHAIRVLFAALGVVHLLTWAASSGARNPCLEPGNLTHNCGFDAFVDQAVGDKRIQVPEGWGFFVLSGDLDFRPAEDTYWGAPSLWLLSDGVPFVAGVYQQVAVTPGLVYQADVGWAAATRPDFERKIGLDPSGGTDPMAPAVVWGPSAWEKENPWPDLTVSTRATGPTMTVFVWVNHPRTYGNDWIFLDAVGLWQDLSQPAATDTPLPPPTATLKPPTRTPSAVPPSDTPTATLVSPTATQTPTWTPTPIPTSAPSSTPTWTPSVTEPAPTELPMPTRTPLPTVVSVAQFFRTPEASMDPGLEHASNQKMAMENVFLYIASGALLLGICLAAVALWVWQRDRRDTEEGGQGIGEE